jgi:N4-gp56 family major capsid protein
MAVGLQYTDTITTGLDLPAGTAALPHALRTIYSAELQYTATPMMVFDQFSEIRNEHRLQHGQQAVWTIYRQMAPTIGALTENADVETTQIQDFQVAFGVYEYGNAVGTTEKLDLLSYHGPISSIVRDLLAPQMARSIDRVARNVAWAGAPKRYAGGRASRADLTATDYATVDTVKQAAHALRMNRVRPTGGGYMAVVHPSVLYDLREDPLWEDTGKYSDPSRLASGEVGRLYGVRFVEADDARLPNVAGTVSGSSAVETTLNMASGAPFNSTQITVASATGIVAGDELTIHPASMSVPDGTSTTEENVIVKSVSGNVLTLEYGTAIAHANGAKVRKGIDVFPMMFMGADKAYAKSVVQSPEVRVALPTDKLRRMNYVGWYALQGHGVIRNWTYLVVEAAASQNSAYIFGW